MKISLKKIIFVLLIGFLLAGSIYGFTKSFEKSNSRKIYYRNETTNTNEDDDSGESGSEEGGSGESGEEGDSDDNSEENTGTEFEGNVTQECKDYFTEHDPLWRYGIKMSLNDTKTVATLTMNAPTFEEKTIDDAVKAMAFRIVTINNTDVSGDETYSKDEMILKNGGSISVSASFIKEDDENVMIVYLESALNTQDPVCTGKSHFEAKTYSEGNAITESVTLGGGDSEKKEETFYSASQCEVDDLSTIKDDKLREYCEYIKSVDLVSSTTIIDGDSSEYSSWFENNRFKSDKIFAFKCPAVGADGKIAASLFRKDAKNENDYYINHAYLEATKIYPIHNGVTYDYNYAPGLTGKDIGHGSSGSCEVKCTEKVTVDYGPPQVVRAGICLEYFIKVKSVVDCKSTSTVDPPDSNFNYCVPVPWCTHATSGQLLHQAGPDDNFDDCVESCDGGKYTTRCSDICYKKLYGKGTAFENMYAFDSYSDHASKMIYMSDVSGLSACYTESQKHPFRTWKYTAGHANIDYTAENTKYSELGNRNGHVYVNPLNTKGAYYGCYYWSGSSIKWWGNSNNTPARWYSIRDDYYYPNGKPYGELSEGEACVYATDGSRQCGKPYGTRDGDGFFYKWKSGGLCNANCYYSGCNKTDYLNPGMMKLDYEENMKRYNSVISACNAAAACSTSTATYKVLVDEGIRDVEKTTDYTDSMDIRPQEEDVNEKLNNSKYLVDFGGCYTKSYDKGSIYKAEIGVQTTWIRNKDGIVSYTKPKSSRSYTKKNHQYCLPADISEVNKKWWLFFYSTFYKDLGPYSINDDELADILNFHRVTEFTKDDENAIKYNIEGTIRNFGHFGWNFDISCFYAYNNLDDKKGEEEYRIRTVDLNNLFPAENESGTRLPGFNWSKYSNGSEKTGDFEIAPSQYAKWVEKTNYSVYSKDYLDYEIVLSASDIREIRKDSNTYLENISDDAFVANDVLNYKSQLLQKLQDEKGEELIKKPDPDSFAFKCNNIVNYSVDDKCEDRITNVDNENPIDDSIENPDEIEASIVEKQKKASINNSTKPVIEK